MDKNTLATLKNLLTVMEDDIFNRNMSADLKVIQNWINEKERELTQ